MQLLGMPAPPYVRRAARARWLPGLLFGCDTPPVFCDFDRFRSIKAAAQAPFARSPSPLARATIDRPGATLVPAWHGIEDARARPTPGASCTTVHGDAAAKQPASLRAYAAPACAGPAAPSVRQ